MVSPFLKLATFNIQGIGSPEEYIVLGFNNEPYAIDLRWDKIIFTTQRKVSSLFEKSGPTSSYFEIFERLKALDSFGQVQNALLATWWVNESLTKERYLEKYVKKQVKVDEFDLDDIAIVEEYTNADKELVKVEHGFFKPEKDLQQYGIIDSDGEIKKKSGQFVQLIMVKKSITPSIDEFKKMNGKLENIFNNQFKI